MELNLEFDAWHGTRNEIAMQQWARGKLAPPRENF
jgi:hypothetical protein